MRPVFLTVITLIAALEGWSACAASNKLKIIRCTARKQPDVVMTLNDSHQLGRLVSCISGDFAVNLTPCAQDGGYGLSAPTGDGGLVKIVDRWQDYVDYDGGATSYAASHSEIYFTGGFSASADLGSDHRRIEEWVFEANRLTGRAVLSQKGKPKILYACRRVRQRF